MTNSDNKYGTFNKRTKIYEQIPVSSDYSPTVFADVTEARNAFHPAELQTIFDECCTNLQFALVADDKGDYTKLKVTYDFGTKGLPGITEADDWAGQFQSRKEGVGAPTRPTGITYNQTTIIDPDSVEHLF